MNDGITRKRDGMEIPSKPPNAVNDSNTFDTSNGFNVEKITDLQAVDNQVISKPPNDTNDGNTSYTSNESNVDKIPDLEVVDNQVISKPPNDTNDGNTSYTSNESNVNKIPDLEVVDNQVISKPPNDTNDGNTSYTSNESNVDKIPDLEVVDNQVISKPPNDTNDGNTSYTSNESNVDKIPDLEVVNNEESDNIILDKRIKRLEPEKDFREMYEQLKKEHEQLKKEHEQLRRNHEKLLRKDKDQKGSCFFFWKQTPAVRIQMYAAVKKDLCEQILDELEKKLSIQFEKTKRSIKVEKYHDPPPEDSSDESVPLIVICMNASRLGIDVDQALIDVSHIRTQAVVVVHHQNVHALPKVSSKEILCGSHYKHISDIVDIAYLTTKGIYPCEMNEQSLRRLENFIMLKS